MPKAKEDNLGPVLLLGIGGFLIYSFFTRPKAAATSTRSPFPTTATTTPKTTSLTIPSPTQTPTIGGVNPPTANRNDPAYVKWVQSALNKIIQAGLVVDGIYGPLTTTRVRTYQGISGIYADGIVGPQTEAAIIRDLQASQIGPGEWY